MSERTILGSIGEIGSEREVFRKCTVGFQPEPDFVSLIDVVSEKVHEVDADRSYRECAE